MCDNTKHASYWKKTSEVTKYPKLQEDITVDTVVVGGGIAGISTAFLLAKEGQSVALVESKELCHGTTGKTTAKLTAQHNLIYSDLLNLYGREIAKQYYEANMRGLNLAKEWIDTNDIDCELKEEEAYVFTEDKAKHEIFDKEMEAYEKIGINGEIVDELPIDMDIEAGIRMNGQYQFHPVKFLSGLLEAISDKDIKIFENTMVTDIEHKDGIVCSTNLDYEINCKSVVFATHYPTYEPNKFYANNVETESSYALAVKTKEPFTGGMYINADKPKRTFRGLGDQSEKIMLVGGESHTTGDGKSSKERYDKLEAFAKEQFGAEEVVYKWSSHDLITPDRIPFVGKLAEEEDNVYVLTGFGKWGLSNGIIGAEVIAHQILNKPHNYTKLFDPGRERKEIKKDKSNEANSVKLSQSIVSEKDLKENEATIIEKDDQQIGVYKDEHGELHYVELSCTHMGCGLKWNDGDLTWDCPCHGSRFEATGDVYEGPAMKGLKKLTK